MKGLIKIYLKYTGPAVAIIFLFLSLVFAMVAWSAGKSYVKSENFQKYSVQTLAENMKLNADKEIVNVRQVEEMAKQAGAEFLMLLNEGGEITWSYRLPRELNHNYSAAEIASFSRWYLGDYPVTSWEINGQLLVLGYPAGSVFRYSFYQDFDTFYMTLSLFRNAFLIFILFTLLTIGFLGYRYYRKMMVFTVAMEDLAAGREVLLSETGSMREFARSINQTSDKLKKQAKMLSRRDEARTEWISGVSHDIRTPLSLVLGYSNLLEEQACTDEKIRKEASVIRQESLKIRDLIEDLNLTSKLEYHMQPLRMEQVYPVQILRKAVADLLNSIVMEEGSYPIQLRVSREFESLNLKMDEKLMARAFRNVIGNCVRHNEEGCEIDVEADCSKKWMRVAVTDTGQGIPAEICRYINEGGEEPKRHIMGLRIVKQIVNAHGGRLEIEEDGHRVTIQIPLP